jgi:hypothetical protein
MQEPQYSPHRVLNALATELLATRIELVLEAITNCQQYSRLVCANLQILS